MAQGPSSLPGLAVSLVLAMLTVALLATLLFHGSDLAPFLWALLVPLVLGSVTPRPFVYGLTGLLLAAALLAGRYLAAGPSCAPDSVGCWDQRMFSTGVAAFATSLGLLAAALGTLARRLVSRPRTRRASASPPAASAKP